MLAAVLTPALFAMACAASTPSRAQDVPPPSPAAAPVADTSDTAKLIATKCTVCHDLQIVNSASHAPSEWPDVVATMRSRGADLTDDQAKRITDYLAKSRH